MVCSLFICPSQHTKTAVKVHYLWPKTQFGFNLLICAFKILARPALKVGGGVIFVAYDKHRQRSTGAGHRTQSGQPNTWGGIEIIIQSTDLE